MAYLTQTDIANLLLSNQAGENISLILQDIIDSHLESAELADMQTAEEYYNYDQDINDVDFREYYIRNEKLTDTNASNNHIVHPFFTLQVDQKAGYIAGNPIAFGTEDQDSDGNNPLADDINEVLAESFEQVAPEWITEASKRGREFLHPYVNEQSEFDFVVMDARQCVPVYDSQYEKDLLYMIRFYEVEKVNAGGITETIYKVEWWDKKFVTFYTQEKQGGNFLLDSDYNINPRGHFKKGQYNPDNTLIDGTLEWISWGMVPFIKLSNNKNEVSDLKSIKPLIDNYDRIVSRFANKIEDFTNAVWKLAGYSGTDLREFVLNLKTFGVISLQEGGSAEMSTSEIPYEAHNQHLEKLEDNIYIFGRAVDPRRDDFGNSPSGVALKYMYILLDLKANVLIRKMKKALREFMFFVCEYLKVSDNKDYNYKDVTFTFNKSILINEFEIVQMLAMSKGMISDEKITEEHPRVDDPSQELERLEKQRDREPDIDLDTEPIENAD